MRQNKLVIPITICLGIIIIAIYTLGSKNSQSKNLPKDILTLSQTEKDEMLNKQSKIINSPNKELVAKVGDKEIYQKSIDSLKITYQLSGKEMSDDELLDKIIMNNLLLLKANELGIETTDEEVEKEIDDIRKSFKEDDEENKQINKIYNDYIEELDFTEDEYWKMQKESYKYELTRGKLYNKLFSHEPRENYEKYCDELKKEYRDKITYFK